MVVLEVPCLEGSGFRRVLDLEGSGFEGFRVWSLQGWAKARLD